MLNSSIRSVSSPHSLSTIQPNHRNVSAPIMAEIVAPSPIWEEIDRAESYLVCCMFDEAASLSSSLLRRLLERYNSSKIGCGVSENCENEWDDLLVSAGMVFVQSLNQLHRTSEILSELKMIFGSLTAIPVQVFITAACFQVSENPSGTVQGFLEEYLSNWNYVNGRYYPHSGEESCASDEEGSCFRVSLGLDRYLEVVELYVITLLSLTGKDTDLAISFIEKAMLPMDKRQEFLTRLQSMKSCMPSSSSQTSRSPQLADEYRTKSETLQDQPLRNGHRKDFNIISHSSGESTTKEEILKLSRRKVPCIWWFPCINLKFGNNRLVVPSGKLILVFLLLLLYYFTRQKQAALRRVLAKNVLSIKNAFLDFWKLAFSYQVNPLAAVESLPTSSR